MFNIIQQTFSCFYSYLETVQEKGLSQFFIEKLQECNPLGVSSKSQKKIHLLRKDIHRLKKIKKTYRLQFPSHQNMMIDQRIKRLNKTLYQLKIKLKSLQVEEIGKKLLQLASPSNLIFPGIGDSLRLTAYGVKLGGAIFFTKPNKRRHHIKKLCKEVLLAGSIATSSHFVYHQFYSLKHFLADSNFRSIFHHLHMHQCV